MESATGGWKERETLSVCSVTAWYYTPALTQSVFFPLKCAGLGRRRLLWVHFTL